jgi:hypothetical protein
MDSKPVSFSINPNALNALRNHVVHIGDVSTLAGLRDSRRALTTNLNAINEAASWVEDIDWTVFEAADFEINTFDWESISLTDWTTNFGVRRAIVPQGYSLLVNPFDFPLAFDFEKEADRLRQKHPPLLAARLVALLRLRLDASR